MRESRSALFIQNRTHRAGAQSCLARLLRHPAVRQWQPVVLCSPGGWLVEECGRSGVPVIEEPFPRSRSLVARLFGNAAFARRVAARLAARSLRPSIVFANDHQEGLLGLEIGKRLGAPTAIFLRSSAMTESDFRKYRCDRYDFIGAVGEQLLARVRSWESRREIVLVQDGIFEDEIVTPKRKPSRPPDRVLVVGSALAAKGWSDLTEALFLLEQEGVLPPMRFDFTGARPDPAENDLKLGRLKAARCEFIGRVEAFRDLVRDYDLVINPSRAESFGMAAVEIVAAGVPLLSSRTGVIGQVLEPAETMFAPGDPVEMAAALKRVLLHWADVDFGVERGQANIRRRFLIDRGAVQFGDICEQLLRTPRRPVAP